MKKFILILGYSVLMSSTVFAQNAPLIREITEKIIISASNYANAIACDVVEIEPKHIAALVPYTSSDDRDEARYAVLWNGDIGCEGGSGTSGTNICIVIVRTGDSFLVDPFQSSPAVAFESPTRFVDKLIVCPRRNAPSFGN